VANLLDVAVQLARGGLTRDDCARRRPPAVSRPAGGQVNGDVARALPRTGIPRRRETAVRQFGNRSDVRHWMRGPWIDGLFAEDWRLGRWLKTRAPNEAGGGTAGVGRGA